MTFSVEIYHQFDTVIYPPPFLKENPKESLIAQAWKSFKDFFSGGGSTEHEDDGTAGATSIPAKFDVPSRDVLHQKCLQHYLSGYITILNQGSLPRSTNMDQVVDRICHIYNCLSSPKLHDGRHTCIAWTWGNARNVRCIQINSTVLM